MKRKRSTANDTHVEHPTARDAMKVPEGEASHQPSRTKHHYQFAVCWWIAAHHLGPFAVTVEPCGRSWHEDVETRGPHSQRSVGVHCEPEPRSRTRSRRRTF